MQSLAWSWHRVESGYQNVFATTAEQRELLLAILSRRQVADVRLALRPATRAHRPADVRPSTCLHVSHSTGHPRLALHPEQTCHCPRRWASSRAGSSRH